MEGSSELLSGGNIEERELTTEMRSSYLYLLRDKLEKFVLTDCKGGESKLSAAKWQRFNRSLKEYEGWMSSLQAEFGHDLEISIC